MEARRPASVGRVSRLAVRDGRYVGHSGLRFRPSAGPCDYLPALDRFLQHLQWEFPDEPCGRRGEGRLRAQQSAVRVQREHCGALSRVPSRAVPRRASRLSPHAARGRDALRRRRSLAGALAGGLAMALVAVLRARERHGERGGLRGVAGGARTGVRPPLRHGGVDRVARDGARERTSPVPLGGTPRTRQRQQCFWFDDIGATHGARTLARHVLHCVQLPFPSADAAALRLALLHGRRACAIWSQRSQ